MLKTRFCLLKDKYAVHNGRHRLAVIVKQASVDWQHNAQV